jgi:glutamine amidotransferase
MLTVVNYGLGNVQAFVNIYQRLNVPVRVGSTVTELMAADRLILPGVGAFDWAMTRLNESGLRAALDDLVLRRRVPVLGVCVGMQMMGHRSEEGVLRGLGWIDAEVVRFSAAKIAHAPLPHMGWNDVKPAAVDTLFKGIQAPRYYFLHSYYVVANRSADVLALANYGGDFAAAVRRGNVYGTQFHPEKSHQWGIDLLGNFAGL